MTRKTKTKDGQPKEETRGRPPIIITPDQVMNLAQFGLNAREMAAALGVSYGTIKNRLQEPAFQDAIEAGKAKLSGWVKRKLIETAKRGNIRAQIILLENLTDWTAQPKREEDTGPVRQFVISMPTELPATAWDAQYGPASVHDVVDENDPTNQTTAKPHGVALGASNTIPLPDIDDPQKDQPIPELATPRYLRTS